MSLLDYVRLEKRRQVRRRKPRRWCAGCQAPVSLDEMTEAGVCELCVELREKRKLWAQQIETYLRTAR